MAIVLLDVQLGMLPFEHDGSVSQSDRVFAVPQLPAFEVEVIASAIEALRDGNTLMSLSMALVGVELFSIFTPGQPRQWQLHQDQTDDSLMCLVS